VTIGHKFYLDENVNVILAARLRADGFDVLTTVEAGRLGSDDDDQLLFATREGRVLVTHNLRDFRRIAIEWARAGRAHAGLMYSSEEAPATVHAWIRDALDLNPDMPNVTLGLPVAGD
jgi:Domain of unknown function (DUF5615)